MKFLVLIMLCLVAFSIQKCGAQSDSFDQELLVGTTWYHSDEEDREDLKFYRPESYSFPPSKGRIGFQLLPDSSAIYKGIGPNDIPKDSMGNWELSKGSTNLRITVINRVASGVVLRMEYTIVSCQENLVQLRSVNLDSNRSK